ncbi:MAG: type II secretion system F family protein [Candidatus Omnitrophica bacterium]|nr:type II secretion system F family protein [Candidatus Omnitrophota bacterium]
MEILFLTLVFICTFGSVALLTWQLFPAGAERVKVYHEHKIAESARTIDAMFLPVPSKKRLALVHILTPLALGGITYIFVQHWLAIAAAAVLGLILPTTVLKIRNAKRKQLFNEQLVDGLMILSSSLRGGLSMLQAIEVLVEEMPEPISEEFGLALREHKMGVSVEDALEHLNQRMRSNRFNLVMTAILVARETGGNITEVFARLVDSMRESNKMEDKVKTLTLQGKMQGIIMSLLPIVFGVIVYTSNPEFLQEMFENPVGRMLLGIAVVLEIVGSFLIIKLSQVDV